MLPQSHASHGCSRTNMATTEFFGARGQTAGLLRVREQMLLYPMLTYGGLNGDLRPHCLRGVGLGCSGV